MDLTDDLLPDSDHTLRDATTRPDEVSDMQTTIWVMRSNSRNWTGDLTLDEVLDERSDGTPLDVWWGAGKGGREDYCIGALVLLYEGGTHGRVPSGGRGFRAIGRFLSEIYEDHGVDWVQIQILHRLRPTVPWEVVRDDPVLSKHAFCRFRQATHYMFSGQDADALVRAFEEFDPRAAEAVREWLRHT